jgi:hypothetical protein
MGITDKLKWTWDPVAVLTALLDKWRPRNCETEKEYETSLYTFLHRELEDRQITKQSGKGRFHADLVIDEKFIIEIKHNLNTTANYQRLKGQVMEYKDWKGKVILLMIGKVEQNLKKDLTSFLKKEGLTDSWGSEDKVLVVYKS